LVAVELIITLGKIRDGDAIAGDFYDHTRC
jgi:hypothetical protein